jgi:hypothetical protein
LKMALEKKGLDDRTVKLLHAYSAGVATKQEAEELSALIVTSSTVRAYAVADAVLECDLRNYCRRPDVDVLKDLLLCDPPSSSTAKSLRTVVAWATALAACLLVTFAIGVRQPGPESAQLEASHRVGTLHWNTDDELDGSLLPARELMLGRRIAFSSGSCGISLRNGVTMTVTAPASFVMESPMRCSLWQGKLTAEVPENAKGFAVITQHVDVVDLGTRFGVSVDDNGEADIAVFEGLIDVSAPSSRKRLTVGRGVSVGQDGRFRRLDYITPDTFFNQQTMSRPEELPVLIGASDAGLVEDEQGYYRLVPSGFAEDTLAYVDRYHQWNGVDAKGLPAELIGGDYLMPFNADKVSPTLAIAIELSRLADVYVLLDRRAEVPDWLARDFVHTELVVGQDEGGARPLASGGVSAVAKGPGVSIDTVFEVWKHSEPQIGQVDLGPLSEGLAQGRSMYGVVVVPTAAEQPDVN